MGESGSWGGPDQLHVTLMRFRIPETARWMSTQAKGNDYLGVDVSIIPEQRDVTQTFSVEQTSGAVDRSIAENYSADSEDEGAVNSAGLCVI